MADGNDDSARRLRDISPRMVVVAFLLLACFVVQASIAARRDSVTIDEFVHLPVGLYSIYTGDFRPDPINPPHTRMIAALGLLSNPPAFNPEKGAPHWGMGYQLMQLNADTYQDIFVRGRSMIIVLAVLVGILVFVWAHALYGAEAALAALFLFAFSPSMLAHGHLVTLDLAGALGFVLTAFATWRLLDRPSIARAAVAGAALAVATLLKLSGFVLVAAVVVLVAIRAFTERKRDDPSPAHWLGLLSTSGLSTLFVLNAGYAFDGTLAPLSAATLAPGGLLAGLAADHPWLRLPVPIPFINGVDMILNVGKEQEPSFFLAGTLSSEGWWYYHLAAFAMKSPTVLVLLTFLSFGAWMTGNAPGKRVYCVFVPVALLFASNSMFNSLQIGVRHVLSVYPLLFVAAAPWVVRGMRAYSSERRRVWAYVTAVGLLWYAGATLAVAPRYLQYFNEPAGGASGGHEMLVDSNIDWGQDLLRLSEYMDDEGIERINLAYFGRVHPNVYGINFVPLEDPSARGKTAISATFLMGRPYFWYKRGRMGWVKHNTYTWLQEHEPIARAGSMFIYDLP
jgi:hypothetical protein